MEASYPLQTSQNFKEENLVIVIIIGCVYILLRSSVFLIDEKVVILTNNVVAIGVLVAFTVDDNYP